VGLIIELIELLAGLGVSLTIASSIRDFLKKKKAPPEHPEASVRITMSSGETVQLKMPEEEAKRLSHR
jgi:hypothetical protein